MIESDTLKEEITPDYATMSVKPGVPAPKYATTLSAGLDLMADINIPVVLQAGARAVFPTGIVLHLAPTQVGLVFPRSGLGFKHGIVLGNGTGIIDADYTGEVMICLVNTSDKDFEIEPKMKIAQLVIVPFERVANANVEELVRGDSGFGSTG